MKYQLSTARWMTVGFSALYIIILWWAYANLIAPVLAIEEVFYYHLDPLDDACCFILALIPSFFMPLHVTKPSQYINWMLYITIAAPSAIVSPHNLPSRYNVWPLAIGVNICFLLTIPVSNFKPLKLPRITFSPFAFWLTAIIFSIIAFGAMYASYGTPNTSISMSTAESLRAAFKEKNKEVPILVRYFFRWEGNVVAPVLIAYGFLRRKWWLIGVGCVLEQLIFMFTTLREFDLIPFMLITVGLWVLWIKKNNAVVFVAGVAGASAFFAALQYVTGKALISLVFFERFLMVGGTHTAMYYEFFTTHPPALMGASIGKFFWPMAPYDKDVGLLIGNAYFRMGSATTATNATAHYWAIGFGNFGWIGLGLATIAGILLFWIFDSAWLYTDKRIAVIMTVMVALTVNSEGLHTAMLSSGLLPFIVVGWLGSRVLGPVPDREKKTRAPIEPISPKPALKGE